jgi:hypothetical protein
MICLEDKIMKQDKQQQLFPVQTQQKSQSAETAVKSDGRCPECDKTGHSIDTCWKVHPELAPFCDTCKRRGHRDWQCNRKKRVDNTNYAELETPVTLRSCWVRGRVWDFPIYP